MKFRLSIRMLLAVTAYVAVATAACKNPNLLWSTALLSTTGAAYVYALVAICFWRGAPRAAATGFAVAVTCYFVTTWMAPQMMPVEQLYATLLELWNPTLGARFGGSSSMSRGLQQIGFGGIFLARTVRSPEELLDTLRILHSIAAVCVGAAGSGLAMRAWAYSKSSRSDQLTPSTTEAKKDAEGNHSDAQ